MDGVVAVPCWGAALQCPLLFFLYKCLTSSEDNHPMSGNIIAAQYRG